MKGTAMTLVMGGTLVLSSVSACDFKVPAEFHGNPNFKTFSCELSDTCCGGLQDVEHMAEVAKGGGKPQGGKGRAMEDLVGTCSRADQVELYNCAAENVPKMVPAGKGVPRVDHLDMLIPQWLVQAKGCHNVQPCAGTDSGHCSLTKPSGPYHKVEGTFEVDGVSMGCCAAANRYITASQPVVSPRFGCCERPKEPEHHNAQCGMIGACGKEDQKSIMRFAKGMMKGGGPHPAELDLLEMFNMTNVAPQEMLATILTSEDEEIEDEADVTEDDATADGSPIVTGFLGFVAGAAVTGLGVTVLRRSSPSSEDKYNEIVA